MVMRRDLPHARASLATIEPQLGPDAHHFVLVNDLPLEEQLLPPHPARTVLEAGRNLGVAAGRNRLFAAGLDWGADLLVAFDDDLIAPSDYLERLRTAVERLQEREPRLGVVAPAMLDYHAARGVLFREREALSFERGEYPGPRPLEEMRAVLRRRFGDDVPLDVVAHLGIRGWETHYLEGHGRLAAVAREAWGLAEGGAHRATMLRFDGSARRRLLDRNAPPLWVDTLPGGISVVSRALLEDLGALDEAFGPFGFEDSEFTLRAVAAGYRNACLPELFLVHDFQARLRMRDDRTVAATRAKARALLVRKHVADDQLAARLLETAVVAPLDYVDAYLADAALGERGPGDLVEWLATYIVALVDAGLRPLPAATPPPGGEELPGEVEVRALDRSGAAHRAFPAHADVSARSLRLGGSGPGVDVELRYRFAGGRLDLQRLEVRRGADLLALSGVVSGIGPGHSRPERTTAAVLVHSFTARVEGSLAAALAGDAPAPGELATVEIAYRPDRPAALPHLRGPGPLPGLDVRRGAVPAPPAPAWDYRTDVVFMPHNGYHTLEMASVARELERRGLRTRFVDVTDHYRDEGVRAKAAELGLSLEPYTDDVLVRLAPRVLFVMNDWGGVVGQKVVEARQLPVTSIALIEGVQDFEDTHVDHIGVGRIRRPYRHADLALLVGEADAAALAGAATALTGSTRIEALTREPRPTSRRRLVVINSNFTYGLYTAQQQDWIEQAVGACRLADVHYVVSKHHADQGDLSAYEVSDRPLYELLREAGVVVSRFSGVMLEAMALATPVVYFNPHGERVAKFQDPMGAYPVATEPFGLAEAIREALTLTTAEVARRTAAFFARHVSIDPQRSSYERIADAVEAEVRSRAPARSAAASAGP